MNGQYADATESFNDLLHKTNPMPIGFDRQVAAYRLRHVGACAASHDQLSVLGIPRPQKIDVLCVVAGFAICMKALKLPYEKRLMKSVVRYTGRGSNAQDIVDACEKMRAMGKADVKAHVLVADEKGLKHLPKPVIAHVEHDHFVTVVEANEKGVAYICVDCGEWPGGRVDLTWEQWRALEADAYICVVKKGSEPDRVLTRLLDPSLKSSDTASGVRFAGIQVAMNPFRPGQTLGSVSELSATFRGLTGHISSLTVGTVAPVFADCGIAPRYAPCPPNACCPRSGGAGGAGGPGGGGMGGGSGAGSGDGPFPFFMAFGASSGDPVNLATLEEEYTPAPDLTVYNPTGPSVVWQRSYRNARRKDVDYGYECFGEGWTHNYNYMVYDPATTNVYSTNPSEVPTGGNRSIPVTGSNGSSGGGSWEIWKNGALLVSGNIFGPGPNGWGVSGSGSNLYVKVPGGTAVGGGYEARYRVYAPYPGGQPTPLSATFSVGNQSTFPQANTDKYLQLPDGARLSFRNSAVPTASVPVVTCVTENGQPYWIQITLNSDNTVDYIVTAADQTKMVFKQARSSYSTGQVFYNLRRLSDRVGNTIAFRYGEIPIPTPVPSTTNKQPLLIGIDRVTTGGNVPILTINRDMTQYSGGAVLSVSDPYGRSVYYSSARPVTEVSQVVATGTANPPMRYRFSYGTVMDMHGGVGGIVLSTITVPSPTGTGTETATINYNTRTNQVLSLVDANGNKLEFLAVDNAGTPATNGISNRTKVTVKDPQGNVVYWYIAGFNANMSSDRTIDADGNTTRQESYGSALNPIRPTSVSDGMNRTWSYTWDSKGNMLTMTTPRGVTTTYTYDYSTFALGRMMSVQQGTKPAIVSEYFEPSGLVKKVTTPAPIGSGVSSTEVSTTYTSLGNVLTITGPGNNATSTQTVTFSYTTDGTYSQNEMIGRPILTTDPLGNQTHLRFDARGNTISVTDALGNKSTFAHNLADQLLSNTLPATGQNGAGNGKQVSEYQYDGGPRSLSKIYNESLSLIRQVNYSYGKEGELTSETGNTPQPVAHTYDALYRAKTLSDGNNNATMWNYNVRGYLSSVVYPGGDTITYPAHDGSGRPTSRTDGRGITATYGYSSLDGLLDTITFAAPNTWQNVSYTYDDYGRLQTRSDASGDQSYTYGDLDEVSLVVTTYAGLSAKSIGYAYYPNGTRKTMTTPAGAFNYAYDSSGRMTGLTNPFGETTTWTYYANDWAQSQMVANGQSVEYFYNAIGRMTALTNTLGVTNLPSFTGMTYDGMGNRLNVTTTNHALTTLNGITSYSYDTKDQLTGETSTKVGGYGNGFAYDSAGNPTSYAGQVRAYNVKNQNSGTGFAYDGNGNPTTYMGQSIAWDVFDNPIQFGSVMTAAYTSEGLRAWKQTTLTGDRTYFLYDGIVPVCELDNTGGVKATNTLGNGNLVSRRTAGGSVFYVWDERGNCAERRSATGALLSNHGVDAFGNTLTGANSVGDPYSGFGGALGYYCDQETGLILCSMRYYDPTQARWLNRDPITYEGGINLYSFCANNAVKYTDPTGLKRSSSPCEDRWVCSDQEYYTLAALVNLTCHVIPNYKCGRYDDCDTLRTKMWVHIVCLLARIILVVRCFEGGDAGHRNQIINKLNAVANCINYMESKNCDSQAEMMMANTKTLSPSILPGAAFGGEPQ